MVDIETLGTKPGAIILAIGAVEFDIETGKTGREFYANIDLQTSINYGFELDTNTLKWWMNQSNEARSHLFVDEISLGDALLSFGNMFNGTDYFVWGNSNRFDLGLLEEAHNKAGFLIPWDYRKERDVRTLVSLRPNIKENYIHKDGVDHSALSDCYKQIGYCSEIWKDINK